MFYYGIRRVQGVDVRNRKVWIASSEDDNKMYKAARPDRYIWMVESDRDTQSIGRMTKVFSNGVG